MPAGKMKHFVITIVALDTLDEIIEVQKGHHLGENIFAIVHPATYAETADSKNQIISNRLKYKAAITLTGRAFQKTSSKTLGR
jgi:hypothetical protein